MRLIGRSAAPDEADLFVVGEKGPYIALEFPPHLFLQARSLGVGPKDRPFLPNRVERSDTDALEIFSLIDPKHAIKIRETTHRDPTLIRHVRGFPLVTSSFNPFAADDLPLARDEIEIMTAIGYLVGTDRRRLR